MRRLLVLSLFVSLSGFAELVDDLYSDIREAQDTGKYPEYLEKMVDKGKAAKKVQDELTEELERLKDAPAADRRAAFQEILYHWSKSNDQHKQTPLALDRHSGYTTAQLEGGNYDPETLAKNLMNRVVEYERTVSIPIYDQVGREIARDFRGREVLFLGRDFTPAQVWMSANLPNARDHVHMLNVSRSVKDDIEDKGSTAEMKRLLDQIGLTKQKLVGNGLVFVDSSMAGKIPAAILKGATADMTPEETYEFLRKVDVRYLKSSRKSGTPISEKAAKMGKNGRLTNAQRDELLERIEGIGEFKIDLPEPVANYKADKHHLAEHRPKFLSTTTGFERANYGIALTSAKPRDLGGRVKALLGLQADLTLGETAAEIKGGKKGSDAKPVKAEKFRPVLPKEVSHEIDEANRRGRDYLKAWQNAVPAATHQAFANINVRKAKHGEFTHEVEVNGKTRRLKKVGEGHNVTAYLTDDGTVLKIAKDPTIARKNLLLAWADGLMHEYGIPTAKVLSVDPSGLFLEQEYVPGENLEHLFAYSEKGMPKGLKNQIVDHWEAAKKLAREKGVWLDLKAANYQLGEDGVPRFIDYVPRLNKSYYRYFGPSANQQFTEDQFLNEFLHHEHQNEGNTYTKRPKDGEIGWKRWAQIEKNQKEDRPKDKEKDKPKKEKPKAEDALAIDRAVGLHLRPGQKFRLNRGTYTVISEVREAGNDRRVYKVQGEDGTNYVFKHARANKEYDLAGIEKEKTRYGDIREIGVRQAAMIEEGPDWLLREWIEGLEGNKWMQQWEREGYPQTPAWENLRQMLQTSADAGRYIGKLDPEDAMWDPQAQEWVVVDSGGVSKRSRRETIQRYLDRLMPRWSEVLQDPTRCTRELERLR